MKPKDDFARRVLEAEDAGKAPEVRKATYLIIAKIIQDAVDAGGEGDALIERLREAGVPPEAAGRALKTLVVSGCLRRVETPTGSIRYFWRTNRRDG
ncbi:MAG: hypothetical protein FWC84_07660 [Alphaproteobacteria bacterium]|nr:hypothetical protein [Alphaproteobacteria bacterium]